jgi:DNA-binding NarL/FixJ family response regulator
MDAAERKDILSRYLDHARRFDEAAARRSTQEQDGEVIPFTPPLRELEQEPTMREIEVLQLISDGLVNREIGVRLYLSEETVKSHVRHLLAKLQARSRAHAGRHRFQAWPDRLGDRLSTHPQPRPKSL